MDHSLISTTPPLGKRQAALRAREVIQAAIAPSASEPSSSPSPRPTRAQRSEDSGAAAQLHDTPIAARDFAMQKLSGQQGDAAHVLGSASSSRSHSPLHATAAELTERDRSKHRKGSAAATSTARSTEDSQEGRVEMERTGGPTVADRTLSQEQAAETIAAFPSRWLRSIEIYKLLHGFRRLNLPVHDAVAHQPSSGSWFLYTPGVKVRLPRMHGYSAGQCSIPCCCRS